MNILDNPFIFSYMHLFASKVSMKIDENNSKENYEHFVNYLIAMSEYKEMEIGKLDPNFEVKDFLQEMHFGKNCTTGVDGCFFLFSGVNSIISLPALLSDEELQTNISQHLKEIRVFLIQTKAGNIDPKLLGTISACLKSTEQQTQKPWLDFHAAKDIISQMSKQKGGTPPIIKFTFYYISEFDENLEKNSTFKVQKDGLELSMKEFYWSQAESNVTLKNSNTIVEMAKKLFNPTHSVSDLTVDLMNTRKIKFKELYNKVLFDSTTGKRRELYGDNIRDYVGFEQSDSPALVGMRETLNDENRRKKFFVLNNGITMVVSKEDTNLGDGKSLSLENIKIINGCQTAHVIMEKCKEDIDKYGDCEVMLRIIASEEEELIHSISLATNNQTPVDTAMLLAMDPSIKGLSQFFINSGKLQLELRRHEFDNQKSNVEYISLSELAKAYIAVWKNEPNQALQYEEKIIEDFKGYFHKTEFNTKSYFSASLFHFIKSQENFESIKKGRYQILNIMATLLLKLNAPKELETYKNPIDIKSIEPDFEKVYIQASKAYNKYIAPIERLDYRHFYSPKVLNNIWSKV